MILSLLNSNGTVSDTSKQPFMQKSQLSDLDFSFQNCDQTKYMF